MAWNDASTLVSRASLGVEEHGMTAQITSTGTGDACCWERKEVVSETGGGVHANSWGRGILRKHGTIRLQLGSNYLGAYERLVDVESGMAESWALVVVWGLK